MKNSLFMVSCVISTGLWLAGCSPVSFSSSGSNCSVSSPCSVGTNGMESKVTQSVTFQTTNKVDILVVVDNSGSYSIEDQNLGAPINGFIQNLSNSSLDWQVGVTTTDVCPQPDAGYNGSTTLCGPGDNGSMGLVVGPSIPQSYGSTNYQTGPQFIVKPGANAVTNFESLVVRNDSYPGSNGYPSGDERAIFAANLAIDQASSGNAGLFRDNSNLAMVIISNEDERSVGGLIPTDPAYAPLAPYDLPQTLLNKVTTTWNGTKSLLVNSITVNPGDTACYNSQLATTPKEPPHYANIYSELVTATKGQHGSICASSYAAMLGNITGEIAQIPQSNTVTLNYVPNSAPTVTFSGGPAVNYTWIQGTNQIVFNPRPADGTVVTFTYTFNN